MFMESILKAAEGSAGPANLGGGCSMPPLKAFMDDSTIICSKEDEKRRMLARLDTLMAWCRMKFKPKKSRSCLSIRKGKIEGAVTFTIAEQQIPTVSQEPVKSLEIWYDSSMKDTRGGVKIIQFASEGLLAIKKCGLQGLSDVAMYCGKEKLKLPMKSIHEEYKYGKVRLVTMPEDSSDPVVKIVQPSIKTGRKWKVAEVIDEAKECLKMKGIIGQTQTDRKGLGSSSVKWWSKTEGKEK
ncbi:reverse transcriptase [Elysia marginata]|uniref:Reverse transcriptase n=1 Tax=Elysia marginata TaxID=1093978 RepID=A0AAV4I6R5_9GAST|nr:reverse transcriptase [Elysia marginata]